MTPALPAGPAIGERMCAPVYPHRTFRRRAVTVEGAVVAVFTESLLLKTSAGYYCVKQMEAKRA
jgi:hypothetical protein